MKKQMLMLFPIFILVSVSARAQDGFPKAEVFGGHSALSSDSGRGRVESFGFQASVAGNFHRSVGIVGDFGGQYRNSAHIYEYLLGPRFSVRRSKGTVFVHALFGGVTAGRGNGSDSAFAMGFGGGIDVNVNNHFAVRGIQFDWTPIHGAGAWDMKSIRLGLGIVIK